MLPDFELATIIQACIRLATIITISFMCVQCVYSVHWLFNMEFLTFIGHSDYVGDGVETCLVTGLRTGLINAGINVVGLQFIGDL